MTDIKVGDLVMFDPDAKNNKDHPLDGLETSAGRARANFGKVFRVSEIGGNLHTLIILEPLDGEFIGVNRKREGFLLSRLKKIG